MERFMWDETFFEEVGLKALPEWSKVDVRKYVEKTLADRMGYKLTDGASSHLGNPLNTTEILEELKSEVRGNNSRILAEFLEVARLYHRS